jgi:hypothetical protein
MSALADKMNAALRPLGGFLRCETCRHEQDLGDVGLSVDTGWRKCCGYTMRWWTQRQVDAGEVPA